MRIVQANPSGVLSSGAFTIFSCLNSSINWNFTDGRIDGRRDTYLYTLFCTYVWPSKYNSLHVCKYSSMQVCKYASMKYASMEICKYATMQVCKYASMELCKYASTQVCKYANM